MAKERKISVKAADRSDIPIRSWAPELRTERAAIALHGLITHSGWFAKLGESLAREGVTLFAPDRRGSGAAVHLPHVGEMEILFQDFERVLETVRSEGYKDITLVCWCWGAKLGLPAALRFPIDRIVLASPALFGEAEVGRRFRDGVPVNGYLPVHFDPVTDFTDDGSTREFIERDSLRLNRIPLKMREITQLLGPVSLDAVSNLKIPLMTVLSDNDKIIDMKKTAEFLKSYPLHWFRGGGHGFVIEPKGPEMLADKTKDFILQIDQKKMAA